MPFDRSGADLTAHALWAWWAWLQEVPDSLGRRVRRAMGKALAYLRRVQRADGSWAPLWFGNQFAETEDNLTYGTARVLISLQAIEKDVAIDVSGMVDEGAKWLLAAQNEDGGWQVRARASIEETALAVTALARLLGSGCRGVNRATVEEAVTKGTAWLISHTEEGQRMGAAPIGFYFSKLWYFEKLYPLIYTAGALEQVRQTMLFEDGGG